MATETQRVVDPPIRQLERVGPAGMSDADLLALVLAPGEQASAQAIAAAHAVAEQFPLERLVTLPWDELRHVPGLPLRAAATLAAAVELARRGLDRGIGSLPKILHPSDVLKTVPEIRNERREHFVCLYLNARTQLIHKATISIGTLNSSLVHPREVFAPALENAASAIILVHNHPSGDPSPSREDLNLTRRLVEAGLIMGIEIVDHVVISADRWVSFKQTGEL